MVKCWHLHRRSRNSSRAVLCFPILHSSTPQCTRFRISNYTRILDMLMRNRWTNRPCGARLLVLAKGSGVIFWTAFDRRCLKITLDIYNRRDIFLDVLSRFLSSLSSSSPPSIPLTLLSPVLSLPLLPSLHPLVTGNLLYQQPVSCFCISEWVLIITSLALVVIIVFFFFEHCSK